MAVDLRATLPTPYHRRRPERTGLDRTVAEHLETYRALRRADAVDADPVLVSVECERCHDLRCG
jgi:hypothetical protein